MKSCLAVKMFGKIIGWYAGIKNSTKKCSKQFFISIDIHRKNFLTTMCTIEANEWFTLNFPSCLYGFTPYIYIYPLHTHPNLVHMCLNWVYTLIDSIYTRLNFLLLFPRSFWLLGWTPIRRLAISSPQGIVKMNKRRRRRRKKRK